MGGRISCTLAGAVRLLSGCRAHVHNSFDYQVGRRRVVANPRGLSNRRAGRENLIFQQDLLLELVRKR